MVFMKMDGNQSNIIERFERLGKKEFTISICYGPCGDCGLLYSVDILSPTGNVFENPIGANSFIQAIEIAEKEILNIEI